MSRLGQIYNNFSDDKYTDIIGKKYKIITTLKTRCCSRILSPDLIIEVLGRTSKNRIIIREVENGWRHKIKISTLMRVAEAVV